MVLTNCALILHKVVLSFVDKTLVCDQSVEGYRAEMSCGTVRYVSKKLYLTKVAH